MSKDRLPEEVRDAVIQRCSATCFYCGVQPDYVYEAGIFEDLTVDHVVAVALGGTDEPTNLVAACRPCNSRKGSRPATQEEIDRAAAIYANWVSAGCPPWATMVRHRGLRRDFVAGARLTDDGVTLSRDLMLQFGRGGLAPVLLGRWLAELVIDGGGVP